MLTIYISEAKALGFSIFLKLRHYGINSYGDQKELPKNTKIGKNKKMRRFTIK